jgi:hypothetical protein
VDKNILGVNGTDTTEWYAQTMKTWFQLPPALFLRLMSLSRLYSRVFSIAEIQQSVVLQWMFGASLFFFFVTFSDWITASDMTIEMAEAGRAVCWPYVQKCYELFFFRGLQYGYSQSIFYMALYAIITAIVWALWSKKWILAHILLTTLFLWKAAVIFVFVYTEATPFHYYHIILTAFLLFGAHKEFFLKIGFVFMYFMSATTKFDDTWVLGTYFSSLKHGLPILPDALTPLFTNIVIFMQIIGCWFLLSRNWLLQRLTLSYFVLFHLYSGIFVTYTYPSVALPALLILFGPMYLHTPLPISKKALVGWLFLALVAVFQLLGFIIPGDRRLSLEGNHFGMFMFEANHQCVAEITTYSTKPFPEGSDMAPSDDCTSLYCTTDVKTKKEDSLYVRSIRRESSSSWHRCDPYVWWARLHRRCELNPDIQRVQLIFDHSINGGPFYRIVDAENVCDLQYKTLEHNEWILFPPEAQVMGYPVQNTYHY